jgi:hypothetical protein
MVAIIDITTTVAPTTTNAPTTTSAPTTTVAPTTTDTPLPCWSFDVSSEINDWSVSVGAGTAWDDTMDNTGNSGGSLKIADLWPQTQVSSSTTNNAIINAIKYFAKGPVDAIIYTFINGVLVGQHVFKTNEMWEMVMHSLVNDGTGFLNITFQIENAADSACIWFDDIKLLAKSPTTTAAPTTVAPTTAAPTTTEDPCPDDEETRDVLRFWTVVLNGVC